MRKTWRHWTAGFLSLVLGFTLAAAFCAESTVQALSEGDFYVNSGWSLSHVVTSPHTARETIEGGYNAYTTATSTIGDSDIGVTATFKKTEGREDGISYLSDNGNDQSAYGVTYDMLYGSPTPANIPALGIDVQPGSAIYPDAELTEEKLTKMNLSGVPQEEGILTFTFDQPVTDPILDLSGLGGFTQASAEYYMFNPNTGLYDGPYYIARASFNSTDLEVLDANITPVIGASNSNLMIENKTIKVINRNTHTRAYVDYPGYAIHDNDNDHNLRSPNLEPAGCGSIILKGTFNEVSIKLYHVATPYSAFPTAQYGTSELYFWHSNWGPQYGDGTNGLNILISEKYKMADEVITGRQQNLDLFRASIRLQKPSSIGDKVWLDKNNNGIQDQDELGLDDVTVKLLDENGNPAKDYNGNPVADQVTQNGGQYKFENLAAGKYYVQVVPGENQGFSEKSKGGDASTDSDFIPETGMTDLITLEPNTEITEIDAGIVNLYKVTHEFISGTDGKELPQEVKNLTPEDQTGKKTGETVTPTAPPNTTVNVEDGTWTFVSYDRENDVINQADAHFIGKWVFEEKQAETGNVYVKYITEDGTVLEAESAVKTNAPDGEAYTTAQKDFSGYEFVKLADGSAPANGNVVGGQDLHVTYVYKEVTPEPDKGNVYVKYITEDGTVLEAESAVKTNASDGEAYTTAQKDFPGYEFVKLADGSAPANGNVVGGQDLHVTYVYKEVTPEPDKGNVYVKYITEDGQVLEAESAVKTNASDGEAYTTEQKDFSGYEFVKLADDSAPAEGAVKGGEDLHVTYVYKKVIPEPDKGNVYVKYITEDGQVLEAESAVKTNATDGEAYTTEQKDFSGYEFVKLADDSAPAEGAVKGGEDLHVTYVYKKVIPEPDKGNVYVKYITEDGQVLEAESAVKTNATDGEAYTTTQKDFPGYEFVKLADDSAPAEGAVKGGEDLHVTYVYKKVTPEPDKGNVYVKYITEDGQVLEAESVVKTNAPDGEAYTTAQKDFSGYEFVKLADGSAPANGKVVGGKNLYVTYVYKAVSPQPQPGTGNVYVKYISEDGKVLEAETLVIGNAQDGAAYSTTKKYFLGYEFVKLADGSAPANGKVVGGKNLYVTYVYKRLDSQLGGLNSNKNYIPGPKPIEAWPKNVGLNILQSTPVNIKEAKVTAWTPQPTSTKIVLQPGQGAQTITQMPSIPLTGEQGVPVETFGILAAASIALIILRKKLGH